MIPGEPIARINKRSEERIGSPKEIRSWLKHWARELGLAAWDIDVRLVRGVDLDESIGEVDVSLNDKRASIKLCRPEDYSCKYGDAYDMEQVLVHELVHIVLEPLVEKIKEPDEKDLEQAVESIAWALVNTLRAG